MFEPNTTFEQVLDGTRLGKRDYQVRLGTKALAMFGGYYRNGANERENAARTIAIESPTGSGKTPLALCIAKTMQANVPDLKTIWVSMRRNLLSQAEKENTAPTIFNPDGKDINADVHFLSMFSRQLPEAYLPENRTGKLLFIHDEMQHDAAATAAHLHNELKPDWVLGVSAFPQRTDRIKLAFEKTIKDAGIHELIQAGYLSPYEHYSIPDWSPLTVANFYLADPDRWGPSLAFFNTLELCAQFRDAVNRGGCRCELVDASTDREDQIDRLKAGALDILVNCAILTEGFNFPDLKTCFLRNSWKGCTIQMGGRIFRPSRLYQHKQLVQSKDTDWPFVRTATPVQQWVWRDGGWLTLRINDQIERVIEDTRLCISQAVDTVPKLLKDCNAKGRKHVKKF